MLIELSLLLCCMPDKKMKLFVLHQLFQQLESLHENVPCLVKTGHCCLVFPGVKTSLSHMDLCLTFCVRSQHTIFPQLSFSNDLWSKLKWITFSIHNYKILYEIIDTVPILSGKKSWNKFFLIRISFPPCLGVVKRTKLPLHTLCIW